MTGEAVILALTLAISGVGYVVITTDTLQDAQKVVSTSNLCVVQRIDEYRATLGLDPFSHASARQWVQDATSAGAISAVNTEQLIATLETSWPNFWGSP